jgi:hypothetical protein
MTAISNCLSIVYSVSNRQQATPGTSLLPIGFDGQLTKRW